MAISKKMREQMLELCGSICDDDGLVARDFHRKTAANKTCDEYKQLRLCEQVARTLALTFADSTVDQLRELKLEHVKPGKQSAGLRVQIRRPIGTDAETCALLLAMLKEQEGWLRSEVACAITRKRVPSLTFEFLSTGNVETHND